MRGREDKDRHKSRQTDSLQYKLPKQEMQMDKIIKLPLVRKLCTKVTSMKVFVKYLRLKNMCQ